MYTANQDVHALTQKSSSILPITPSKLKLETSAFKIYMLRATKKYKWVFEVKPKPKDKALRRLIESRLSKHFMTNFLSCQDTSLYNEWNSSLLILQIRNIAQEFVIFTFVTLYTVPLIFSETYISQTF